MSSINIFSDWRKILAVISHVNMISNRSVKIELASARLDHKSNTKWMFHSLILTPEPLCLICCFTQKKIQPGTLVLLKQAICMSH